MNQPKKSPLEIAIEALARISEARSAYKDHPGRTWAYRDWELRQIAKHALNQMQLAAENQTKP